MKTVLVTGGCGYIGSHVTRQLSEAGYKVVVIDNLSTGFRDALINGEELVVGNVGDKDLLHSIFSKHQISAVLHFAASIIVPDSVAMPLSYYENNTVNTLRLLESMTEHKIPNLIFSSTAAIYGNSTEDIVTENSPAQPANPYARSKLMDEWAIADASLAHSLKYVVIRYFNVAGADPELRMGQRSPQATHLIKVASEVAVGLRKELVIHGDDYPTADGTGVRDYIHIEDIASAHLAALSYLEKGGPSVLVNCGYGKGYSVKEVLRACKETLKIDVKSKVGPRRAGDVAKVVADASRIRSIFKWVPKFDDLGLILRHAYLWEKKLHKL